MSRQCRWSDDDFECVTTWQRHSFWVEEKVQWPDGVNTGEGGFTPVLRVTSVLWLPLCGLTGPGTLLTCPSARRDPGDGDAASRNVMASLHRPVAGRMPSHSGTHTLCPSPSPTPSKDTSVSLWLTTTHNVWIFRCGALYIYSDIRVYIYARASVSACISLSVCLFVCLCASFIIVLDNFRTLKAQQFRATQSQSSL